MSDLKDSLYDISDAIALSRKLIGRSDADRLPTDTQYIRFSAGPARAVDASAPQVVPVPVPQPSTEPTLPPLPEKPFENWEEVLRWCVEYTSARCGFIVDSQGFVMMTHGERLPGDGFEGAGANLGTVFLYLNRLELESGDAQIADLTFASRSFLTLRINDKTGEYCMLGLISDDRECSWPKYPVYDQIMKSMSELLL